MYVPKTSMLFCLSAFQQRCAGEADKHGVGQDFLHRVVQIARLRAVTLVDKDVEVTFGFEIRRQAAFHFLNKLCNLALFLASKLVDERAEQPGRGGVEFVDQVLPAFRAVDVFVDALEHLLDLLVQFGAVGDDQDTSILHILANPLGQPDHGQAFAAALGVPDDAALALAHPFLRRTHTEVLVVAADLLHSGIEHHEIVDHLQKALFLAELRQSAIQRVLNRRSPLSRSGNTSRESQ